MPGQESVTPSATACVRDAAPVAAPTGVPVRVIPRLDIKAPHLVKGVRMEGLRVVGDPAVYARRYSEQGADELLCIDTVATLYGRPQLLDWVERTARELFIPLTVGGGVRTLQDIQALLRAGADRVTVNTAALRQPGFVREAARACGAQCIVVSIEASRQRNGRWLAFTDNGREPTDVDAIEWARRAVDEGAGELLLTSIERDGTRRGYDLDWLAQVLEVVPVPVVIAGGANGAADVVAAAQLGASGAAVGTLLHQEVVTVADLHDALLSAGFEVRT